MTWPRHNNSKSLRRGSEPVRSLTSDRCHTLDCSLALKAALAFWRLRNHDRDQNNCCDGHQRRGPCASRHFAARRARNQRRAGQDRLLPALHDAPSQYSLVPRVRGRQQGARALEWLCCTTITCCVWLQNLAARFQVSKLECKFSDGELSCLLPMAWCEMPCHAAPCVVCLGVMQLACAAPKCASVITPAGAVEPRTYLHELVLQTCSRNSYEFEDFSLTIQLPVGLSIRQACLAGNQRIRAHSS